jgi:hypothetical protein
VNIITAYKSLADNISLGFSTQITNANKSNLPFSPNSINVLTSETDVDFQSGKNNIGTTFKTGANITDKNGVLFVVFPSVNENLNFFSYGIFSDGISSIVQAIGRIRNGGTVHLFIDNSAILIGSNNNYPLLFQGKSFVPHLDINKSLAETLDKYQQLIKGISTEIKEIEKGLSGTGFTSYKMKEDFGFWYPNEHEFILTNSQDIIMKHENVSFGRLLSPYIFWSCLNNQFTNATLKKITYYRGTAVKLTLSNSKNTFDIILKQHSGTIKSIGFRKAVGNIGKFIGARYDVNGNEEKVNYEIAGKKVNSGEIINRNPSYLNKAVESLFELCNGTKFPSTKEEYINACINEAKKLATQPTLLVNTYNKLGQIKTEFLKRLNTSIIQTDNKNYILVENEKIVDDAFLKQINLVVNDLKEHDSLLKNKAFSFMQDNNQVDERKKVYAMLSGFFLDLNKNRKQISNKQHFQIKSIDPLSNISLSGLL